MLTRLRPSPLAWRLLLAALLVFAQQQAVVHQLGHGLARLVSHDAGDPPEPLCAKCVALAHLDHANVAASVAIPPTSTAPAVEVVPDAAVVDLPFVALYRSRAPPSPA